jgi:hypothetical protein
MTPIDLPICKAVDPACTLIVTEKLKLHTAVLFQSAQPDETYVRHRTQCTASFRSLSII